MKQIILITILLNIAPAAILRVGGGNETSITVAHGKASAGDTIELYSGSGLDSTFINNPLSISKKLTITSTSGRRHKVQIPTTSDRLFQAGADSIYIIRVDGIFDTTTPTANSCFFYSMNRGGHKIYDCIVKDTLYRTTNYNMAGVIFRENDGLPHNKVLFRKCKMEGFQGGLSWSVGQGLDSITTDSCIFYKSSIKIGNYSYTNWNIINMDYAAGLQCDADIQTTGDIEINHNFWNANRINAELLSFDGAQNVERVRIKYNTFVNNAHDALLFSGFRHSNISHNNFPKLSGDGGSQLSTNSNVTSGYMGLSDTFEFNTIYSNNKLLQTLYKVSAIKYDSIIFRNNLLLGTGNCSFEQPKGTNLWFDSNYSEKAIIDTGWTRYTDTAYNRGKNHLLDTVFSFVSQLSDPSLLRYGSVKYLTNKISDTIYTDTLSVLDSLNAMYRHDNEYYDTGWVNHNSLYTGDTAKIRLYLGTSNAYVLTKVDSAIVAGGKRDTLKHGGLTNGTYYYYTITEYQTYGTGASTIYDTSLIGTFTYSSTELDTAKISYRHTLMGSTAGGSRVDIIGTNFSTAGTVYFGTTAGTVKRWTPNKITVVSPAHAAGQVNLIVNPTGDYVPDTTTFTYQSPRTADTIFVDSTITDSSATYNPVTRLSTGGTHKCYQYIQPAVNCITTGNEKTICLRKGTNYGTGSFNTTYGFETHLTTAMNGQSWTEGHYNLLCNYNGELAIISAKDSSKSGAIIGYPGHASRRHTYWKFKGLSFKGGKNYTNDGVAGIWMDGSHFVVDSCYFDIGFLETELQTETPAGCKGLWKDCIISNCYFGNSEGGIGIYADYADATIAINGFTETETVYSPMRNSIKNNYFYNIQSNPIKYKSCQFYSDRSGDWDTTYADCGDTVKNNILYGCSWFARSGIAQGIGADQDFMYVANNIIDSCSAGIRIQYEPRGQVIGVKTVNNTFYNTLNNWPIYRGATEYYGETVTEDFDIFGSDINNIFDAYNGYCLFTAYGQSTPFTWHKYSVSNNFFHGQSTSIWRGVDSLGASITKSFSALQTAPFASSNYNNTTASLWASKYIPNGSFVVNGSTTISNGAIGGTYIGAVDPASSAWVGNVLGLVNLGVDTDKHPAVITEQPFDTTVSNGAWVFFGVTATGTELTYQWYANDTLIEGATSNIYSLQATSGLDGSIIFCLLTTDTTISTDTVVLTVNPASVYPIIDTITPYYCRRDSTFIIHGSNFGTSPGTVIFGDSTFTTFTTWTDSTVTATVPHLADRGLTNIILNTSTGLSDTASMRVKVPLLRLIFPNGGN